MGPFFSKINPLYHWQPLFFWSPGCKISPPKNNSQVIGLLFVARKSIEKFHHFPLSMVHLVLIFFIVKKESCTYMKFIFQGQSAFFSGLRIYTQTEAPEHFLLQFSVQRTHFAPLWAPLLKDSIAPKRWRESTMRIKEYFNYSQLFY
jgi:hypothetical protein